MHKSSKDGSPDGLEFISFENMILGRSGRGYTAHGCQIPR